MDFFRVAGELRPMNTVPRGRRSANRGAVLSVV